MRRREGASCGVIGGDGGRWCPRAEILARGVRVLRAVRGAPRTCPSASSIAVMPSDQTSALVLYPACGPPEMTSGAIQKGVPMTVPRLERVEVSCCTVADRSSTTRGVAF